MRVIAGTAKGRPLKAVPGMNTRPTTDKVKEAIFSMIGPYFDGGLALDLFAGTGGLGIEVLSRGADKAIFIDREKISIDVIRQNVNAANLADRSEIYRNDADRAVKAMAKRGEQFRYIFLDPPYKMTNMDEMLLSIAAHNLVEPDAIIVVEHDSSHLYPEQFGGFIQRKYAKYGETAVTIYDYQPEQQVNDASEDGGNADE
ncbi:16S rRNA (guanine(966)-N(2))-methyltransferase RsmD [Paenibacillus cellulosilyticus]|uniref:16S rRNA (Guanine(966)-N(2))-methyltransferase RsmD n=1 Tax=Paenibacillus cellulosilyticus TaxID=375489 RepID=A0A2V2YYJ6_9BACL|nr:16S rRNA (guanine(966)-N(2))-methyltransferase RsmD [Paenibacillus cellulosilyticus]PWW06351.1 16S rRNA (guanine(966)-N(2))-methyltransferase RsmD [Paenibacillus cellulosilyticus]QKS46299.1 16S rRNA (guanine(966)-N(2))-methyltransferase RsmD [Paenibacillus cellulosilyticus]